MKAIIPAAGFGTRFFPVAKTVPKELLPIGARPAIQWIAEEAIEAGAEEVVIVTSPNKPQLQEYFSVDVAWRERLKGKTSAEEELDRLEKLSEKLRFVQQKQMRGLGDAVLCAAPLMDSQGLALVLLGDALVSGKERAATGMVRLSKRLDGASVVGLEVVPEEKVSRYGIAGGSEIESNVLRLNELVEKPSREEAPSRFAVAGRYLLDVSIFDLLKDQCAGCGGEIQLTDAIRRLLPAKPVYGWVYPGKRHDIGNPAGYLACLNEWNNN